MKKYILNVTQGQLYTAGSKAKEDIKQILIKKEKYSSLDINYPKSKLGKLLFGDYICNKKMKKIPDGATIVYQYPSYSRWMENKFIKYAKKKSNLEKILIIHDLDCLRKYINDPKSQNNEKKFINSFDKVIAHNDVMKDWMEDNGIVVPIVPLQLFDYVDDSKLLDHHKNLPILFAGNLEKSIFLNELIIKKEMDIFGINPSSGYHSSIKYKGSFSPDDLSKVMIGSYGLVWDGVSIDTCTGVTGEYMRYNNPHKVSLYLQLGIPVIIWEKSALSEFIIKNKLGISIDSLNRLDSVINSITDEQYNTFKKNAQNISYKIRDGYFIRNALRENS